MQEQAKALQQISRCLDEELKKNIMKMLDASL